MTNLKRLFLLIFPIIYILYILYLRFHLREPRLLDVPKSYILITVYSLLLLLAILRLYIILKNLKIIVRPPIKNKFLLKVLLKFLNLMEHWDNMWIHFYQTIIDRYFKLNFVLLYITRKWWRNQRIVSRTLIVLDLLSQIIVVFAFLIDIFIFHCFYYFYCSLPLLLIPLIIKTLCSILFQFHLDNCMSLRRAINVIHIDPEKKTIQAQFKPDTIVPDYIEDISDFMRNHYIPVISIVDVLLNYDIYKKDFFYEYIILVITLMYVIGWSSLLLF